MTAIAAAAVVALLVVIILVRLAGLVVDAIELGRRYAANRPARHAFLLSHDARFADAR